MRKGKILFLSVGLAGLVALGLLAGLDGNWVVQEALAGAETAECF